ncbi:MAG: PaeR7I family type II restriction endonuclease [Verrucomicrobia bacterium]|nr:PaeR7I family type II restriction endonuclease [Verrucomicrobiota bacterium]
MGLYLANSETKTKAAVKAFWKGRSAAHSKQVASGKADQGERSAVTGGKNMDGFISLVADLVKGNGLKTAEIYLQRKVLTLPGYFRPTKLWDMLVVYRGLLISALEFKSQVGPSFGNNFNNRAEEAIGTAADFWTAYREGAFGEIARPFLGWIMLVEDAPGSRSPVRDSSPHFPVFPDFRDASYVERYHILCKRLMQEQFHTAAACLASPRTASKDGRYSSEGDIAGLGNFVATFAGHIAAAAAR